MYAGIGIMWDSPSFAHMLNYSCLSVSQDNCVHVYTVDGDKLTEKTKIQASADITAAAYSPDGAYLAVSMGRNIKVYETASFQV